MNDGRLAVIYVATEEKLHQFNISFPYKEIIEDLCIKVCRLLKIGPVARHLFALRNHSTKVWASSHLNLTGKVKYKFDFRLRFKPPDIQRLKQIDMRAYDYYFHQVRIDVMDNKVPEIIYEKHKSEMIGLGVCDMYRVMLEKKLPQEVVESDYKKYIPKEYVRRHAFFLKKPVHNELTQLSGHDHTYVKEQYLQQFDSMAPNYLFEEYKVVLNLCNPDSLVLLRVKTDEVQYKTHYQPCYNKLCAIEDLCFVSIRADNTVEVSRKNGIPSYLKFDSHSFMLSFVTVLDGYYRLSVKWTFNLCGEVITPSLLRLYKLKCHGPVGREFSYAKLKEKRANKPGTYILRQSEIEYDVYYIDFCGVDGKPLSQKVEQLESNEFALPGSTKKYSSLSRLLSSFQVSHFDPSNLLYLIECLPPSEYDVSPLLICALENVGSEITADEEIIANLLEGGPRCVSQNELQIHKVFSKSEEEDLTRVSDRSSTKLYQATWRIAKDKKLEVALKILRNEDHRHTKEFLELASKWGQLRSGALARLYGITMSPRIGMLFELVKLGSLDKYLRSCSPQTIETVDLVEATACLATALWHLEESRVVHGYIRCEKLLVHAHTNNSFVIKLADPGLFTYTKIDVHWIPPECYGNLESAKRSFQADVWALATTIWQIFSKGILPPMYPDIDIVKKFYECGNRLPKPKECPDEIYKLIKECWGENTMRKEPQAIMRDINQILYQVYNSRRGHSYSFPKFLNDRAGGEEEGEDEEENDDSENKSMNSESQASSLFTDHTSLAWDDTDCTTKQLVNSRGNGINSTEDLSAYLDWLTDAVNNEHGHNTRALISSDCTLRLKRGGSLLDVMRKNASENGSLGGGSSNSSSLGQISFVQDIFELDADCNLILQGRIGQGFYGEVFKGMLEKNNEQSEQVAVKKLKTRMEADQRDFEREINIMKSLTHPNIVKILTVMWEPEPCLVMEYIKNGSLQSYLSIHRQTLTHDQLLNFALDIATGMDYLGRMKIVHRDLAARNILVADENRVKISDFGLAQVISKNDYYILQTNRNLPIKWYAPESLRDGKFSKRSDVWSFGVTMYEIFSLGEDPKLPGLRSERADGGAEADVEEEGGVELLAALERGVRLPCPSICPQMVYVKLIYPCWHLCSQQRPDFATLCVYIQQLLKDL